MTFESPSLLSNTTKMSLDQRFTQLRSDMRGRGLVRRMSLTDLRLDDLRQQSASAKSRRLALQMSQRPTVLAALNGGGFVNRRGNFSGNTLRRGQFRGRGGRGTGLRTIGRDRKPNGNFGGPNRLRRSSSVSRLGRSQSVGRLSRSQSLQSLNNIRATSPSPFRNRGGRGGRGRGGGGRPDFGAGTLIGIRTGRVGNNPRRGARGRGRGGFVPRRNNNNFGQRQQGGRGGFNQNRNQQQQGGNQNRGGARGRGFRGGRGRGGRGNRGGRGAGGRQQQAPPTKEKLDMELDEYMAATKSNLDKEIDTYMSKTEEVWEA